MPSSNAVNLQGSGPYNWRPPVEYFTDHAKGFSVEVGTPSLPTLEAWKRAIPAEADRWPIGDVWAYHDWHQTGNGAVKSFTDVLERRFGPATGLEDFERKALPAPQLRSASERAPRSFSSASRRMSTVR